MQPALFISGFRLPITDFIFPFVFLAFLSGVLLRKIEFRFSKFYLPLIIYFFVLFLSAIFSENQKLSLIKFCGELYLFGLAVLSFNLIQTTKAARKIVYTWLAATFITTLVSFIAFVIFYTDRTNPLFLFAFSHYGTLPPGNYPRIHSTFLDVNMYCNYLNVSLIFALSAFALNWIKKFAFVIFTAFYSIAAVFTISPGLGGIFLCIGIWFWLYFAETRQFLLSKLSLIFGLGSAFAFYASVLFAPNVNSLAPYNFNFFGQIIYPSERLLAWQQSLQTVSENPIFGRGIGLDVVSVISINAAGRKHFIGDSHQMWLNIAGQAGILGFAAICFVCYYFLKRSLPLRFKLDENEILRLCFGLSFIGAFLYQNLSGSYEDGRHLWVLLGLLGSFTEQSQQI